LGCQSIERSQLKSVVAGSDVLVSCLPLGVDLDLKECLPDRLCVLDANYTGSALVSDAKICGCQVVPGLDWLLHQAFSGFELLTGRDAPHGVMRAALQAKVNKPDKVALVGFMGVGKSTIGRVLADLLGYSFVDTDALVEERAGMSVSEIFSQSGEAAFRKLESEVLRVLSRVRGCVFSCGGGLMLDPANRAFLRKHSQCVWLWAKPSLILDRIKGSSRPLLQATEPGADIQRLLLARRSAYALSAEVVFDVQGLEPKTLAGKIRDEIHRTG
jgi:shikimate kinase